MTHNISTWLTIDQRDSQQNNVTHNRTTWLTIDQRDFRQINVTHYSKSDTICNNMTHHVKSDSIYTTLTLQLCLCESLCVWVCLVSSKRILYFLIKISSRDTDIEIWREYLDLNIQYRSLIDIGKSWYLALHCKLQVRSGVVAKSQSKSLSKSW